MKPNSCRRYQDITNGVFVNFRFIFCRIESEYQDGWSRLWEEHYNELYHYYYQAYHSVSKLDESDADKPVTHYDINEHLALLNLDVDAHEFIVNVPAETECIGNISGPSTTKDIGCTTKEASLDTGVRANAILAATDRDSDGAVSKLPSDVESEKKLLARISSDSDNDSFRSASSNLEAKIESL